MNNLELWASVSKTDPSYTKKVTMRGGYTSISPQYQMMCATEQFGPYGSGWGFESIDFSFDHIETLGLVIVSAVFFYIKGDIRSTFPIKNSWPIRSGKKIDDDFAKKAETNTMSKALSKLGFSADIFMGDFDNPDYVQAVGDEFAIEKAEDKIEEQQRQDKERDEWVGKSVALLETAQSSNELRGLYTGMVRKANLRKDKAALIAIESAKDKRKDELQEPAQ